MNIISQIPPTIGGIYFILIGLLLGSFASALTYRIPLDKPWAFGRGGARSSCPSCKKTLGFGDLVPVFSWLASKGRCRHCKNEIHYSYIVIEIASAILALLIYLGFQFSPQAFWLLLILPFLLSLYAINVKSSLLPRQLLLILLAASCAGFGLGFLGMSVLLPLILLITTTLMFILKQLFAHRTHPAATILIVVFLIAALFEGFKNAAFVLK